MTGYVRAERDRFKHHLFRAGPWCRGYAWDWMVAQAAWRDHTADINGKTVVLKRGQFYSSVRFMAEKFGWSKSSVDRFLTRLKTETMIGTDTGTGQLVITICNYEKYQTADESPGTVPGTPTGTGAGQERDKEEEGKEGKEGKKNILARAARLPDDWRLPKKWGVWAQQEGLDEISVRREAEKFRDYWHAAPGQRGVKRDWYAVWRNWVRKALESRGPRSAPVRPMDGARRVINGRNMEYSESMGRWVEYHE